MILDGSGKFSGVELMDEITLFGGKITLLGHRFAALPASCFGRRVSAIVN